MKEENIEINKHPRVFFYLQTLIISYIIKLKVNKIKKNKKIMEDNIKNIDILYLDSCTSTNKLLKNKEYQEKMAISIAFGIINYNVSEVKNGSEV